MIWSATTLSPLHLAWYWSDVGASLGHNNTKHLGPRSDSARVICSMPLHQRRLPPAQSHRRLHQRRHQRPHRDQRRHRAPSRALHLGVHPYARNRRNDLRNHVPGHCRIPRTSPAHQRSPASRHPARKAGTGKQPRDANVLLLAVNPQVRIADPARRHPPAGHCRHPRPHRNDAPPLAGREDRSGSISAVHQPQRPLARRLLTGGKYDPKTLLAALQSDNLAGFHFYSFNDFTTFPGSTDPAATDPSASQYERTTP